MRDFSIYFEQDGDSTRLIDIMVLEISINLAIIEGLDCECCTCS